MQEKKSCNCEATVGCSVRDCKYHSPADVCSAAKINVSNARAQSKTETFCATFENRVEL